MSRSFQFCLLFLCALAAQCAFFAGPVSQANAQESDQDYQKSIGEIGQKIKNISRNLNANKALVATERDKLMAAEQRLNSLDQSLQKIEYDLARNQHEYEALSLQIDRVIESQSSNREALRTLLSSQYLQAKPDLIKQLLNQENPYAVGRLSNYYQYFSNALKGRFELLAKKAGELAALKHEQSKVIAKLNSERKEKTKLQADFQKSKQLRADSIARLDKKIASNAEILEKLKDDRERLQSLLHQLKAQAAELKRLDQLRAKQESEKRRRELSKPNDAKPKAITLNQKVRRLPVKGGFVKQKGLLSYPVEGELTRRFGSRLPKSGMLSEGIFFNTKGSVSVKTIFRGRVLFADFLKGYGLLIIVDHGDDHISLYGHNDRLLKNVGDTVASGDVIANSGVTGGLKSHGLYFEIRDNAIPIDASKWCR
ncbi:MAG: peptidoglycan DD-metalloendopeptidase family protein [Arenicella sp.]|nr:peptidoglycan DD-metalloendopeptidase family protein [Arenicella sp.]